MEVVPMHRWLIAALLPLALACTSTVTGDGDGICPEDCGCNPEGEIDGCSSSSTTGGQTGGAGGSASGGGGPGGAGPGSGGTGASISSNGIAMLESELPDPPDPGSGTSSSSGGPGPDPNTLRVSFSDLVQSCDDWYASLPCGGHWEVHVSLPPEAQMVGVVSLATPGVYVSFSDTGEGSGDECSFGGGGWGSDGAFTVVSIDETQVTIDFGGMLPVGSASGPLTALRCF